MHTAAANFDTAGMDTGELVRFLEPKEKVRTSSHSPMDKKVTFGLSAGTSPGARKAMRVMTMYQTAPSEEPLNLKVSSKKSLRKLEQFRERSAYASDRRR
jgi:hypothetical protein